MLMRAKSFFDAMDNVAVSQKQKSMPPLDNLNVRSCRGESAGARKDKSLDERHLHER